MKQPNVFGKMFEGGDQRGNRWTQGGEGEGGKEEGGELTLINTIIKKT
jgi:hypothetical protein